MEVEQALDRISPEGAVGIGLGEDVRRAQQMDHEPGRFFAPSGLQSGVKLLQEPKVWLTGIFAGMKHHPTWLRLENKFSPSFHPGFLISNWCGQFKNGLESASTRQDVWSAKCHADEEVGCRSFAVEVLFTTFNNMDSNNDDWLINIATLIAKAGINYTNGERLGELMSFIAEESPGLENCLTWHVTKTGEQFNYYRWMSERPGVTIESPVEHINPPGVDLKILLDECKSDSQHKALRRLATMAIAVERFKASLDSVKLNRAAWIVGPSGSGKTWVANQFARGLGLPTYCATIGSWSIRNARSDHSTVMKILRLVERGPATIIIDEIDKFHIGEDNGNWFRAVLDEIMMLSTGDLQDFSPSPVAVAHLKNSWFVYAGAFQALYRKKLGGQPMTIQEVEELTLSLDDIAESGWLPDELLNRMGSYIEVGPPTVDELAVAMLHVEEQCEISVPESERDGHAKQCVLAMQGFRGLENYASRCAVHAVLLQAKAKRQPPPIPPDAGPKNPSWF